MNIDFTRFYGQIFDFENARSVELDDVNIGDTLFITYRDKERLVLVLNVDWDGKMHGVALEKVMPAFFTSLERNAINLNPLAMYRKYDASYMLKRFDAYRTYDLDKITNMKNVNKFNATAYDENHVFFYKRAVILATDGDQVLAEQYPELLPRITLLANNFGVFHPLQQPQNVIRSFISRHLPDVKHVRSWEPLQSPASQDEAYTARLLNILDLIQSEGGVFFLTLKDAQAISSYLI